MAGGGTHKAAQTVVVAGASGLLGTALCASYRYGGHSVTRLVRRQATTADERCWDPADPDPSLLDGADVLVNLAGSPLTGRWTAKSIELLRTSRINTARALRKMVDEARTPMFLSASGIRWYGIDRGDEELTEASDPGPYEGVLPRVARDWEEAAGPTAVHLRLGLVLSRHGGLLKALLPLYRAGLGMRFGTGKEYWSHVSLADAVGAIRFLAKLPDAGGPYNVTAPHPARNRDFATALGRALRRPVPLSVPFAVLRPALGGVAEEVFGGLNVKPARLEEAGFGFRHPDVDTAIRAALTDG